MNQTTKSANTSPPHTHTTPPMFRSDLALTPSWASKSFKSLLGTCPRGQTESILSRLIPQRGSPAGRAGRVMDPLSGARRFRRGGKGTEGCPVPPRVFAPGRDTGQVSGSDRTPDTGQVRCHYQHFRIPILRPVFSSQQNDGEIYEIERGIP